MTSIFTTKNLTPSRLSLMAAFFIALAAGLQSIFTHTVWYKVLVEFAVMFILSYFIIHYTLKRFIYRKIKLIYKLIFQTKATKKEEFFYSKILPQKSIDEVHSDVERWATQRKDEIAILQKNEQYRREFLLNLAHELRTPIFTVQGYVDTLLAGAIHDPEVNIQFLSNASKGIDRLVGLVGDLNEISQLESGAAPLKKENFSIQELIKDIFEEFSLKAQAKQMDLQFKKGTENTLTVHAEKEKIRQVIVNLVENAIKYSIAAGAVYAGCYVVDEKSIYIEISDEGPGIGEEHLPRIFERFYRVDRNRNSEVGGTGLGLAIVKHIVEAHGHSVTVRSTPGVGTSFGFTLDKAKTTTF